MAKRERLDVVFQDATWKLKNGGQKVVNFGTKMKAVARAAREGKKIEKSGGNAQLFIHRKDGQIQDERTYGDDPRRSKG